MTTRFFLLAALWLAVPCSAAKKPKPEEKQAYLFTSFRGDGDGLHLATSPDGRKWTEFGDVFLRSEVGGKLMRDPHILRGPDGVFRLVWTSGWGDKGIGYASSLDMKQWSPPRYLPLMEKVAGTKHCWAPETIYDARRKQYIITWSSEVDGRFPETVSPDRGNNRTYYVTTKNFERFSEPKIFINPGFDHIDTTIIADKNGYLAVFKEGDKQAKGIHGPIYSARSKNVLGPYKLDKTPLITQRAEGPTLVKVGDKTLLYVDYYGEGRYGVYETTDWKNWVDVSAQSQVVQGQRHGTIFPVSLSLATSLMPAPAPPPALPGPNADPHIAVFNGTFYIYPTTDGFPGWGSTSFSAWSSKDLKNWKNEGVILDLPRDLTWANARAWAPAIATKNGKYFFYFCADANIGVGVADRPEGPFKDALGKPLVTKGDYAGQSIDPMTFVDDDGKAYLTWGQGHCYIVPLNEDMISFDKAQVKDITPPGYNEGPFLLKRKGIYYLMWSEFDTRDPRYSVAYGTSTSPLGPFTKAPENPILKQKGDVKGAGHHSVVQIPGTDTWVIVYHRFIIPGGNGFNRETSLSPMRFDEQGRILPADPYEVVK